jgi:membrane-bound inhibitor of C-type lysozyme
MSRTSAHVVQADIARTLRAARQVGAREVDIKFADGTTLTVKLTDPVDISVAPLAAHKEIVL